VGLTVRIWYLLTGVNTLPLPQTWIYLETFLSRISSSCRSLMINCRKG